MTTILEFFDALRAEGVLRGQTWAPWRVFLAVLFGLPMSESEARLYRECTGRTSVPTGTFAEGWLVCGRRAGKSFVLALVAVYIAVFLRRREKISGASRKGSLTFCNNFAVCSFSAKT
jgi:hypothetical protein